MKMRPQDFVLLLIAGALAAGAVGVLLAGPLVGVLLAAAVPLAAKVVLGMLTSRRQRAFADQLEDSLQLMSSGLRAGHSLLQALDGVSQESHQPASEEFARIINETRVGRDMAQALDETAARMASKDFAWVAQAIAINRQVGGNLAEVLDTVGGTIRERGQIRRQVKALSAEGKLSAIVLMALPFGVTGFLARDQPGLPGQVHREPGRLWPDRAGRRAAARRRAVAPQGHHPEVLTNHVRKGRPTPCRHTIGSPSGCSPSRCRCWSGPCSAAPPRRV